MLIYLSQFQEQTYVKDPKLKYDKGVNENSLSFLLIIFFIRFQILDKRVLPSLAPLFDNPRLDRELRMMLRERFAIFVGKEGEMEDGGSSDVMVVHADDLVVGIEDGGPRFSDDEEDEKPEHNRLDSDDDDDEKKLVIENSDVANKSKTKKDRQQKGRNSNNRRTSGSATTDNADDDADVLDEDAEILLKNLRLQEDCESR